MKVYVVYRVKIEDTGPTGDEVVGIVRDNKDLLSDKKNVLSKETDYSRHANYHPLKYSPMIEEYFFLEEHTVMSSPRQLEAAKTFNEVSGLSSEAKQKLGMTPNKLFLLQMEADATSNVGVGDTLYVESTHSWRAAKAEEVYSYKPPEKRDRSVKALPLFANVGAYFKDVMDKKANKELQNVSSAAKNFLKDFNRE